MSVKEKISFIGGDKRQSYMAERLSKMGFKIMVYGLPLPRMLPEIKTASSMSEALDFGTIIIGPVPFSKNHKSIVSSIQGMDLSIQTFLAGLKESQLVAGGCFSPFIREFCEKHQIKLLDFMCLPEVCMRNAVATAEGAIAEAITRSPVNLHKNSCLVLGYGKCARVLACKLKGLDTKVTISARKPDALENAAAIGFETFSLKKLTDRISEFSFIFNTIPAMVLNKTVLEHANPETIIIDIASCPGGVDQEAVEKFGIQSALCLGLPGKYAPKTSADILTEALLAHLT